MPHQRLSRYAVTPAYEDAGLFKNEVCTVLVDLVPVVDHNSRGDVVIRGFVNQDIEIAVTFAGRRALSVAPIVANLKALGMRLFHAATENGLPEPVINKIRVPVHIEGAWRPRFQSDPSGWDQRTYHLIAARWALKDKSGKAVSFGAAPLAGTSS